MNRKRSSALTACRHNRPFALAACSSNRLPPLAACSSNRLSHLAACSRKRRRAATDGASTLQSDASSWASLHEDLVRLIGWRVLAGDLFDYVRFRAVCPNWRSSTVCPRGRGVLDPRFHPRRWMMLPEGHGLHPGHGKLRKYIRFFNLSTGVFVRVRLPLFSNHCILDSVDGLLLLQRDQDTAVLLLHPFTGDTVELPPLATLRTGFTPRQQQIVNWSFHRTVSATSFRVSADGVVTVMIALFNLARVACATTMDQQWRLSAWTISHHWRPMSFQGKIYMMRCPTFDSDLQIFEIDLPRDEDMAGSGRLLLLPEPKLIATCTAGRLQIPYVLAECNSEILVIGRNGPHSTHVLVYRLNDIILDRIVPVTSIGGNALFVEERVLSVSSRVHPTIVGDSVVILHPKEYYLGQYHLADQTWVPTADGCIKDNGGQPSPCSLIYHILTCCHRATWNKGALLYQGELQPDWKVKRKWRQGVSVAWNTFLSLPSFADDAIIVTLVTDLQLI
ncbi:unnamed protein product [Alopecurus aequalis]